MEIDPFNLERFMMAQEDVYPQVIKELSEGDKRSHWMWFIFPQLAGLGHSVTDQDYAIVSLAEAQAYLAHEQLGARLEECTALLLEIEELSLEQIFSDPDDLKFCSSMTLFQAADPDNTLFSDALDKYCDGDPDYRTLERLG